MAWLQVCIVLFLTINGLSQYYPQLQTGQLQRSRVLRVYSICHNVMILVGVPVLLQDLLLDKSDLRSQLNSKQVRLTNMFFGSFNVALILACIHCAQASQISNFRMFEKLRRLKKFNWRPAAAPLRMLLNAKLLLVLGQLTLQLCYLASNWSSSSTFEFLGSVWKFCSSNMICAASLLIFVLLWQITNRQLDLQMRLKQAKRTEQLLQLQREQQLLLNILAEFCLNFRHVLLWYLPKIGLTAIQSGYFLIRIQFGQQNPNLNLGAAIVISVTTLHELAELYVLNSLAGFVEDLRFSTLRILQQATPQLQLVERCNAWMALQLSFQSTRIHIFGIVILNRCLLFNLIAQTWEHSLYMIQNDYQSVM